MILHNGKYTFYKNSIYNYLRSSFLSRVYRAVESEEKRLQKLFL